MSIVRINAITVPPEGADELVARFAARAGSVSASPGFEAFELLRPTDGKDTFLVYTRWRSEEDFQAWVQSAAFAHAHQGQGAQGEGAQGHGQGHGGPGHGGQGHGGPAPVGSASELWSFDVVQHEDAPAG